MSFSSCTEADSRDSTTAIPCKVLRTFAEMFTQRSRRIFGEIRQQQRLPEIWEKDEKESIVAAIFEFRMTLVLKSTDNVAIVHRKRRGLLFGSTALAGEFRSRDFLIDGLFSPSSRSGKLQTVELPARHYFRRFLRCTMYRHSRPLFSRVARPGVIHNGQWKRYPSSPVIITPPNLSSSLASTRFLSSSVHSIAEASRFLWERSEAIYEETMIETKDRGGIPAPPYFPSGSHQTNQCEDELAVMFFRFSTPQQSSGFAK